MKTMKRIMTLGLALCLLLGSVGTASAAGMKQGLKNGLQNGLSQSLRNGATGGLTDGMKNGAPAMACKAA